VVSFGFQLGIGFRFRARMIFFLAYCNSFCLFFFRRA